MPTFLDKVWVALYVIVIFLIACIEYLPVTGGVPAEVPAQFQFGAGELGVLL